jgi:hypothetical protein
MQAIEFRTKVKNRLIQIPDKYRDLIGSTVKVIILSDHKEKLYDAVDTLLSSPLKVPEFTPLTCGDIYDRT